MRLGRPPRGGRGLKYLRSPCRIVAARSSSSRRTWIEILVGVAAGAGIRSRPPRGGRGLKFLTGVAVHEVGDGRPPRGGRGLKFKQNFSVCKLARVVLLAEDVD